jgi:beta-carotene 15,15'-dioxygenase
MIQSRGSHPLIPLASPVRSLLGISWLAVCSLCLLHVVFPHILEQYALYALVVGIVFLGLPHGALDHLVPLRMGFAWGKNPLGISLYLLAYMAIAALYFGLWLWQPLLAFIGFLLATVFHWGQGDVRFLEIF